MKSLSTRRLAGALLAVALLGSSICLRPARAAPGPPTTLPDLPPAGNAKPPDEPAPPSAAPPAGSAPAESPVIRYSRNVAGEAKPLVLTADEFVTWIDKGHRVILMSGQVLVQQGVIRLRCQQAAAIVNLDRLQRQGVLHADLYAEKDVSLEDGHKDRKASLGLVELNTRGELKIVAARKRVLQQAIPDAPLLVRALKELYGLNVAGRRAPAGSEEPAERRPTTPTAPPPPPGYTPTPPPATPPPQSSTSRPSTYRGVAAEPPAMIVPVPPALPPRSAGGPPPAPINNLPAPPPSPRAGLPAGPRLLNPPQGVDAPLRQYTVAPRTGATFQLKSEQLPNGEQASIFTGGVRIGVRSSDGSEMLDIEADNALIWSKSGMSREVLENLRRPEGQTTRDLEFYFSGNVQIRQKTADGSTLLEADEVYLDARRNVSIALSATLELKRAKGKSNQDANLVLDATTIGRQPLEPFRNDQPVYMKADELRQLAAGKYEALRAEVFSSKLPSDPGLKVVFANAVMEEQQVPLRTLFGNPIVDRNGKPLSELQRPIVGKNARLVYEGVPLFYTPYFKGDANDPAGPLQTIRLGYNRLFGFNAGLSFDVFDLFHLPQRPNSRWLLDADYMSERGPALGTTFDHAGLTFFEMPAKTNYFLRAFGMYDEGEDILGGNRGQFDDHPEWRGRLLYRQNVQELPSGFVLQAQLAALSDHNFYEQYFKFEYDTEVNQNTYLYVKQTLGSLAWTGRVEQQLLDWVTAPNWLPRVDGHLIGYSFLDRFTYHANASAGFATLQIADVVEPPVSITDQGVTTGRFDLMQELSLPFYAGPVKLAPYVMGDLAFYTEDLDGNSRGRAWGGGGVRASMPLSRLYPDVHSLLFNVEGLYHKMVFGANYFNAFTTTHFRDLPQLDRLNDDATNQALFDIRPQQRLGLINPANGPFLATSALFDPQVYAVRRLVDNRVDTLDAVQVVQLDLRQRLQTKRGFPSNQHTVDWMTLNLSGSIFPTKDRDNFGSLLAFLEYDYVWNIGDRTSLVSTGWVDPIDNGPRVFTVGAFFDRPDRTQFYLGYRQIDPVESKALTGSVTYIFSPKYAMTGAMTYDFGTNQTLSNSVMFTRLGADLNVSLGFTYNTMQDNFGIQLELVPNLVGSRRTRAGGGGGGVNGGSLANR